MDLFPTVGKTLIALLVLLALFILLSITVKRLANRQGLAGRSKLISILGSSYLGVKKSVSLVEIPGAVLVLGVTAERINLLHCIDDRETIDALKREKRSDDTHTFPAQLKTMMVKRVDSLMPEKPERTRGASG